MRRTSTDTVVGDRLHRDRLTRAGYAGLSAWAWFLYGFGAMLPLIRAEEETSRAVAGLHSLALATGGLIAGLITVPMVRRLHRRGSILLGVALALTGILALTLAHTPWVGIPAVLVAGIGGSTLINMCLPALTEHHGRLAAAAISEANAVAATVGLVAPLAVGAGMALGLSWRPAAWLTAAFAVALVLLVRAVPRGEPALDAEPSAPATHPATDCGPGRPRRLPRSVWAYAVVLMTCVGVEFSCVGWVADLVHQRTHLDSATSSLAVTALVGGMAVGRFALGTLAVRFAPITLLFITLWVAMGGWVITWTATAPVLAFAGLGLLGLGMSGHFPLAISLVLRAAGAQTDRASGLSSLLISLFAGAAPFTLGALADATSTHAAFLVVPALLGSAIALLWACVHLAARTTARVVSAAA